jgi:DNA-binding PadR family transcriptional regulator
MSLKHALLGFLSMDSFSGYDLKHYFEEQVGFFWTATHSQIYRTLDGLVGEGLARVERVVQHDRPNKKLYHLTDAGQEELQDWLVSPYAVPPVHHTLLVQLFFAQELEDSEVVELLEDYAERLQEQLELYRSEAFRAHFEKARGKRELFLWYRTLDNVVSVAETELAWVQQTLRGFRDLTGA